MKASVVKKSIYASFLDIVNFILITMFGMSMSFVLWHGSSPDNVSPKPLVTSGNVHSCLIIAIIASTHKYYITTLSILYSWNIQMPIRANNFCKSMKSFIWIIFFVNKNQKTRNDIKEHSINYFCLSFVCVSNPLFRSFLSNWVPNSNTIFHFQWKFVINRIFFDSISLSLSPTLHSFVSQ